MPITQFISIINQRVAINMRPDFSDPHMKWYASIEHGWIRDGIMNRGVIGNGDTPNNALSNLAMKISGKTLCITKNGETLFNVPENLTGI